MTVSPWLAAALGGGSWFLIQATLARAGYFPPRDAGQPAVGRALPLLAAGTTAAGWAYAADRFDGGVWLFAAVLISWLVAVAAVDLCTLLIPNRLLVLGGAVTGPAALLTGFTAWPEALGGGLALSAVLLGSALLVRDGLGGGDVKLGALLGFVLGWKLALLALFLAFLLAAGVGALLILLKRKRRSDVMAFGPFLAAGACIALFWGAQLVDGYLRAAARP